MFSDTKSLAAIPGANQERVAGDQIVAVATELLALAADLSIEAPQLARDLVGFSRRLEAALAALASTGPARGQRGAGLIVRQPITDQLIRNGLPGP